MLCVFLSDEQVPDPETLTESSGDGAGRPLLKTADSDDDGADVRKQRQWIHDHLLEQERQVRAGEVQEVNMDGQRAEFLRRWRERYPLPPISLEIKRD